MSKVSTDIDSIIHWLDESTFEIDITLPLRKAGIDSITMDEDYLKISFLNETGLTIDVPSNSDNLIKVIERDLLRWDEYYEGYGLPAYIIERIITHLKEHIDEIKNAIDKAR